MIEPWNAMRLTLLLLPMAVLSTGCVGAARSPVQSPKAQMRASAYERGGIVTLAAGGRARHEQVEAAGDAEQLAHLWSYLGMEGAPPSGVDFSSHVVLGWWQPDAVSLAEVTEIVRDPDGTLRPAFASNGRSIDLWSSRTYVVAVPRSLVGTEARLRGVTLRFDEPDAPSERPAAKVAIEKRDGSEVMAFPRGRCTVPDAGKVAPCRLDDGTPVFVVCHGDGTVHVLAADVEEPDTGVRTFLSWSPRGRFTGFYGAMFDEYGIDVLSPVHAVDRYLTARPMTNVVVVGERVRIHSDAARPPLSPLREEGRGEKAVGPEAFGLGKDSKMLSIAEAFKQKVGEVILLDASLVTTDGQPARLCKMEDRPAYLRRQGCPKDSPLANVNVRGMPGYTQVLKGPVAARVRSGRFEDVTLVWGGYSMAVIDDSFFEREEVSLRPDGTVASSVTFGQGATYAGLDLRVGMAKWIGRARGLREVRDVLLGDTFGFGGRLRLGTGTNGHEAATIVHLGLGPVIANRLGPMRLPSVLGAAVPEVGVRFRSFDGPRVYLGYYLPLVFRHVQFGNKDIYFDIAVSAFYLPADRAWDFGLQTGISFQ